MNGMATVKNIRREIDIDKEKKLRKSIDDYRGPTDERVAKAGDDHVVGGARSKSTASVYTMRDCPLDRAFKKQIISGAEHSALQKYRHHWYHAGQAPTISSLDLDRVFSGEPGGVHGMPKSERQVFHRQRWKEAQDKLGERSTPVVEMFVCHEGNLETCGQMLGWNSKPQAIAGAAELVKDAGYRLAKLWGIG